MVPSYVCPFVREWLEAETFPPRSPEGRVPRTQWPGITGDSTDEVESLWSGRSWSVKLPGAGNCKCRIIPEESGCSCASGHVSETFSVQRHLLNMYDGSINIEPWPTVLQRA